MNQSAAGSCGVPGIRTTTLIAKFLAVALVVCLPAVAHSVDVELAGPSDASGGSQLDYTITVTATPTEAPLANVSVVHSLPVGLAYAAASGTGWSCASSGSPEVVTCDADAALTAGGHVITVSVGAAVQSSDTVLTSTTALEVGGSQQAGDTLDTTIYASDLLVSKLIDNGASLETSIETVGGSDVTFEITVENRASAEVASVRVRDTMPAGMDVHDNPLAGFGTDWSCTVSGGAQETVICDYDPATLAAGATTPALILTATTPDQDTTLINAAAAESAASDSGAHTSADVTVNVFLESDLRINKSAEASLVYSGDSLTYSYTISNRGPHEATSVTVTDTFDRSAAVASFNVSPSSPDWSCQEVTPAPGGATAIECQLAPGQTLPPDASTRQLSLTVTPSAVDDAVVLGNQAEVRADQRLPALPQNTSAVVEVELVPAADLSLARTVVSAMPVDAESAFSWSMEIKNDGPSLARDLTLVESLPEGVMVTGFASPEGWSCSANQRLGSYRCQLDELAVGTSSLMISAVAPRNPSQPGQATAPSSFGAASVDAQTHDPAPGNNQAGPGSITVAAVWDLAVLKGSEAELLVPEQAFTYDITVTNAGPSDLVGGLRPLLGDAFDSRLRGVFGVCATSATEPCWTCGWDARPILDQAIDTTAGATTGLDGAWSLALAPDRNQVYVGGRFDNAIAVLDRDNVRGAGFGQLSFGGFNDELAAPRALAVHPGGEWLVAAGHGSGAELKLFSRNPVTGALSAVFTLSESVATPTDLLFSPDGRFLYLAESGADRIRQLAFDPQAQTLSLVADVTRDPAGSNPVLLGGVAGLALSPDGGWLYAAAPDDQAVVAFSVGAADGHLTPLSTASRAMDNGSGPVAVRVIEAGVDEVFAGGGDSLFVIERSGTSGLLGAASSFVASSVPDKRLQGVSGLALSGDGNSLFVSAAAGAAISLFERDSGGTVQFVRSVGLPDDLEANDAVLDATGERLYVSATSSDVAASTAPDTGAVLVYRTVAAGACNALRSGEVSNDPLEDVGLTVPAGQAVVVTIHAAVKAGTPTGTLSNTAQLSAAPASGEASGQQLSSTKTLDIRNATEVVVTTDAPGQRPVPGTNFAFTVEIVNNGPSGVSGLQVTDLLPIFPGDPAGFVSNTPEWQCSASENACCNPTAGQCGVLQPTPFQSGGLNGHTVDLGAQSSMTFTLRGRIHPAADPNGSLGNQVQLTMPSGIEAFAPEDLNDSHSVDLAAEADIWLKKESLGTSVDGNGLSADFRLTVGNFGPSTVRGVNLQDPLDDLALDAAGASWSCSIVDGGESALAESCCGFDSGACQSIDLAGQSGPIDQNLALAPQARAVLLVRVPVADEQAAEVENTATAATPANITETDPVNNTQSASTRLLATADLAISKDILAGTSVVPGEEVQFQITLTNDGPDGVPVAVSDLFGPELTNVAWTCDATTPIPGDLAWDFDLGLGNSLADASAVIGSADGRHVYALGAGVPGDGDEVLPATLVVFERDIVPGPGLGSLTQLEIEIDGVDDGDDSGLAVEGLAGGQAMTLSPDQRHLYIASAEANAVTVFRREHVAGSDDYGRLVFVESRALGSEEPADTITPVTGLRGASDVAVSNDGQHVYVAGQEDHAVAIFRRNTATGTLAFQGHLGASDLGDGGLRGATSIDIAPNDRDVYVTGKGQEVGFAGPDWIQVDYGGAYDQTYYVDNTPGIDQKWLTQEQAIPLPAFDELYFEFEHRFDLDATYSCFDVGVLEYSLDGGQNWQAIADAGSVFESGGYNGIQNGHENNPLKDRPGWCGRSSNYVSGFDAVRLNLSGLAGPGDELLLRFGLGEGQVFGVTGWWIDKLRLYAVTGGVEATLLDDQVGSASMQGSVVHFHRQSDDAAVGFGELISVQTLVVGPEGSIQPRADLAGMDEQGENLYVGGNEGTIVVYGRDAASGALSREQTLALPALAALGELPADIEAGALAGLSSIAVSIDGEHLIAGGRGGDRLVVFRRQPFVGTLQPMQMMQPGQAEVGRAPGGAADVRDVVFSADGRHVFTVTGTGQLGVFERLAPDPTYGFLEAVFDGADDGFGNQATGLLGARGAALSSDGHWLYVAGFGQVGSGDRGSLAILERDSGATEPGRHLRFRKAFHDLQGGVEGLDGALDVVALPSGDGQSEDIYVASERDSAVTHFRQQLDTGAAQFVGVYRNGQAGVSGLAGAAAIAASPGGQYLFAAGRFDHAVAVFARDPVDGSLAHVGEARDGVDGVSGMLGASALAMSRDGAHLYVAARQSDSVVVFEHDAGMLTYRQTFYDGNEGAVITSPTGIDVTYDTGGGEHVIVTSLDGDAVTVLRRESDPGQEALYGRVRFQQSLVGGGEGLEALISPRGVLVDPSNDRVYVAADGGNALIVLDRNTSVGGSQFGRLYPLETRQNNTRGIIGVNRPYGLAVSTGSRRNIYAASLGSQSVAAFVRRAGSSCAASGGGNLSEEVFIAADGTIRFTVSAIVDPAATGELNNEATISVGDDVTNTGTQTADQSDPRPLAPASELTISKDNARLSVVAGEVDDYRIVVANEGPSHARGVTVRDLLSANDQFDESTAAWSCRAIGAGQLRRQSVLSAGTAATVGLEGLSAVAWTAAPVGAEELGERIYTTGLLGNALTALSIDAVSGEFRIDTRIVEGGVDVDGTPVAGLRGAREVIVGGGGSHIYVASQVDDSLLVFEPELSDPLDSNYGLLRLLESHTPADPGLESLDQPQGMALSQDGTSLYLAAANSGGVYVFSRDTGTGGLTLVQSLDTSALPELGGASRVLVGPEDEHVYVAGTGAGALIVFERAGDGSLSHLQTRQAPAIAGLTGVADLALSPDGDHLYAAGRDADTIVVFPRDNNDGSPQFGRLASPIQQVSGQPGLLEPRALALSADGGSLYVAAFGSNSILVFRRDRETGQLTAVSRQVDGNDQHGLSGVSSLAFSGNDETLFSGAVLAGAITRFDRAGFSRCSVDSGTGDLDLVADIAAGGEIVIDLSVDVFADAEGERCSAPLDSERQCVVNAVQAEWTEAAGLRTVSAEDVSFLDKAARLTIDKTDHLAEFRGLAGARAVTGSTVLGSHLYVAAPGEPGLGVYNLSPYTGPTGTAPLSFEQLVLNGDGAVSELNGVSDLLVSPDGRHVYAASSLDSAVVAFERDPANGHLSWLATYSNNSSGIIGLAGARSMAMDSQGRHLYVAGTNGNAVVVFDRQHLAEEPDYGALSYHGLAQNGTDDVIDMMRPVHLTLSPDDRHLYVAATQSDAVVVFSRNADAMSNGFGGLRWRQSRRNLVGNVSGLLDVSQTLVSPDGAFVYAAGTGSNAVVRFARNTSSGAGDFGRLGFEEALIDGEGGVEGLAGVGSLSFMGGSAQWLVAGSRLGSTLTLFERDTASGVLLFAETLSDRSDLAGARDLWTSPDGSRVHVAAADADSVSVFELAAGSLAPQGAVSQGGGGAVPGGSVEYLITVHNEGPSRVEGARVTDFFPDQFDSVGWSCQITGPGGAGSACPNGQFTGNVDATISLAAGDSAIIEAVGRLRFDASGGIVNEARVELPAGITDLGGGDNVAIDDDTTINSRSDLRIEFENLPTEAVAGASFDMRVVVHNDGPGTLAGSRVGLGLPEALLLEDWICQPDIEPGLLELAGQTGSGLTLARAAGLSRDGRHVYVAGDDSGQAVLAVYDRDPLTGNINLKQQLFNLEPDGSGPSAPVVDGLAGGADVIVSPDDAHVYVAGRSDDAVAMFERDVATGQLAFIDVIRDGIGAVDGLAGAVSLAITGDGKNVYVAGQLDNAVAVLAREASSGQLTFQQVRRNLQGSVERLDAPVDLLLVDGEAALWVAAQAADAIVRFDRSADGSLTPDGFFFQGGPDGDSGTIDGLSGIRSLAAGSDGAVVTLARSGADHALTLFDRPAADVLRLRHRLVDGDAIGTPPAIVSGLAEADEVVVDPVRDVVYVAASDPVTGARTLSAFVEDDSTGDMQFLGAFDGGSEAGEPASVLLGSDGRQLYLAGGPTIDRFNVLAGSSCERLGERQLVDTVDLIPGGRVIYDIQAGVMANARGAFELNADVAPRMSGIDPDLDNNAVIATVPIRAESALQLAKSLQDGPLVAGEDGLWQVSVTNHGPSSIRDIAISDFLPTLPGSVPDPGGAGVVAGSGQWQCTGASPLSVGSVSGDTDTADLRAVAISEDGLWAAAASPVSARLRLYGRQAGTGALTLVDSLADGDDIVDENDAVVGTVTGLAGAADLAFSRDGRHLYVVSQTGNSVTRFAVDTGGGGLAYGATRSNSESSVVGLGGPARLAIGSADDRVYIGARDSSAVTVFGRNPVDGSLQWRQSMRSGIGLPLNLLDGVSDLTISPDAAHLYAAAAGHDAIAIFELNGEGDLAYLDHLANGDAQGGSSVVGLGLVQSLAISPQGRHVYAASLADDSITRFTRNPGTGMLAFDEQIRNGQEVAFGLDGASALVMARDGQYLYAGSRNDGGVLVFEREWADGSLVAIDRVDDTSLASVRHLVGDDHGLVGAIDAAGAELVTLTHQPAGFCGGGAESASDNLVDSISLAAGATVSYSAIARVHPGARGDLVNIAEAVLPADVVALTPGEHSDTDEAAISVVTELDVVKAISGETSALVAGGPVGFLIEVANAGPSHGFGTRVADLLPGVIHDAGWTCAPIPANSAGTSCPVSGSGDIDEFVDVLVGERMLIQVAGMIDPSFRGQLSNTALVEAPLDASDPDADNNESTVSGTVNAVSDIFVSKSVSVPQSYPGGLIEFHVVVGNDGPSDAPQVHVVDTPPSGMTFESWQCVAIDGNCPPSGSGPIDETVAVDADGEVVFTITARIDEHLAVPTVLVNQAGATLGGDGSDPASDNDSDTAEVEIVAAQADLQVTKTVDVGAALPGDSLEYLIAVTNVGPGPADAVRVLDLMPAGLLSVSWTCQATGGGNCDPASGAGDIDMTTFMPVGAQQVFVVTAQIDPGLPAGPHERVVNAVAVSLVGETTDPDPGNNDDTAVTVLDLDVMFRDRFETPSTTKELD